MHLLIPHAAALSDISTNTLHQLSLPHLSQLLTRLTPTQRLGSDEYSLTPPHELALAQAWGWHGADGAFPFAAHQAAADGVAVQGHAWGLLTPVHWHVGRDHISLLDPAVLALDASESLQLLEAVRPLFESEGWLVAHGAGPHWYAAHDTLDGLPCASLDRVIGRNVDLWLPPHRQARLVRRLQSEVQMLLYTHPINNAREARGALPVNSFWLSGCGRAQAATDAPPIQIDPTLRSPLMSNDWPAWAEAWRALDAGPLAALLAQLQRGEAVALTLCGERHAQRFESLPKPLWQRIRDGWRATPVPALLETL